jgi:hypothetical protein
MKKIKHFMTAIGVMALMLLPVTALAHIALATNTNVDINSSLCNGSNVNSSSGVSASCTPSDGGSLSNLVRTLINIFSWIVGVVSVLMIIYGGFRYITSGGESGGVTSAKNTIMYAVIGLVIVALAQIIVRYVLTQVTSGINTSS